MYFSLFCHLIVILSSYTCSMKPIKGVYIIWNWSKQKAYIGSSGDATNRLSAHWRLLKKKIHRNRDLQSDYTNKDGFSFEILEVVQDSRNLKQIEQYYIDWFTDTYNVIRVIPKRL